MEPIIGRSLPEFNMKTCGFGRYFAASFGERLRGLEGSSRTEGLSSGLASPSHPLPARWAATVYPIEREGLTRTASGRRPSGGVAERRKLLSPHLGDLDGGVVHPAAVLVTDGDDLAIVHERVPSLVPAHDHPCLSELR